jgi:hypothetical protein
MRTTPESTQKEPTPEPLNTQAADPPVESSPGAQVVQTGIYTLEHTCSRPTQDLVGIRGQVFPACALCPGGGRYFLKLAVPLANEDPDFQTQD